MDLLLIPGLNNTAAVFDEVVANLPPPVRGHAIGSANVRAAARTRRRRAGEPHKPDNLRANAA